MRQPIPYRLFVVLAVMLTTNSADSSPKVVFVYPKPTSGTNTVGNEAECASRSVFEDPVLNPGKVAFEFYPTERRVEDIIKTANVIKKSSVLAVVGTVSSNDAFALKKALGEAAPLITPTASSTRLTSRYDDVYSVSSSDVEIASSFAEYIHDKHPDLKRLSLVVNLTRVNLIDFTKTFEECFKTRPTMISKHEIIDGFNDYDNLIKSILEFNSQVVVLATNSTPAIEIYNRLAEKHYSGSLYGGDSIGGRKPFLDALVPATANLDLVFLKLWNSSVAHANNDFQRVVGQKCAHLETTMVTATAFDAAVWSLEAVRLAEKTGEKLSVAIGRVKYKGVTGLFEGGHRFKRGLNIYKIKNRKMSFYEAYDKK